MSCNDSTPTLFAEVIMELGRIAFMHKGTAESRHEMLKNFSSRHTEQEKSLKDFVEQRDKSTVKIKELLEMVADRDHKIKLLTSVINYHEEIVTFNKKEREHVSELLIGYDKPKS